MQGGPGARRVRGCPSGEWREATFLFADLADFTPRAEALPPDSWVALQTGYLEGVTEVVFAHGRTQVHLGAAGEVVARARPLFEGA